MWDCWFCPVLAADDLINGLYARLVDPLLRWHADILVDGLDFSSSMTARNKRSCFSQVRDSVAASEEKRSDGFKAVCNLSFTGNHESRMKSLWRQELWWIDWQVVFPSDSLIFPSVERGIRNEWSFLAELSKKSSYERCEGSAPGFIIVPRMLDRDLTNLATEKKDSDLIISSRRSWQSFYLNKEDKRTQKF